MGERQSDVLGHAEHARLVLTLLERRAITGSSLEAVDNWLTLVSAAADTDDRGIQWKKNVFSPVEVFADVVARRRIHTATVRAEQERNKSVAALVWPHDLPDDVSVAADFAGLTGLARIAVPAGAPVVSDALTVARLLRWLVVVWTETEDVKGRRSYVRAEHGPAEPLPPTWLTAVRTAAGGGLAS
ncbi:MAG TPA: DUF6218 family protein [Pseudonocardiaceae bacterium]|nr:DUF6218 family protein [Pseudonocardiaceae bacterium]